MDRWLHHGGSHHLHGELGKLLEFLQKNLCETRGKAKAKPKEKGTEIERKTQAN